MTRFRGVVVLTGAILVAGVSSAWAQGGGASQTGTIAGRVADTSGAVLPGATVTATSPALIGTQVSVTSDTGAYRFPALPPGIYTLTFELAGFTTLRRVEALRFLLRPPVRTLAQAALAFVLSQEAVATMESELEIHAVRAPEVARAFRAADARFRARVADFLVRGLARLGRELVVPVADATDTMIAIVERSNRRALLRGDGSDPNALAATMLPLAMLAVSRPRETVAGG